MNTSSIVDSLLQQLWESYAPSFEKELPSPFHLHIRHTKGSAPCWMASAIIKNKGVEAPLHIWVTDSLTQAAYIENEISKLLPHADIFLFPTSSNQEEMKNLYACYEEAFYALHRHQSKTQIWIVPISSLIVNIPARKQAEASYMKLSKGNMMHLSSYVEKLHELHFSQVDFVSKAGEFAIRGGIVDIFSLHSIQPYRIELEGEKIISLRQFNTDTQISVKQLDHIDISPPQVENIETVPLYTQLPTQCCIWISDWQTALEELRSTHSKQTSDYSQKVLAVWEKYLNGQSIIEFSATSYFKHQTHRFSCNVNQSSQPLFNKNYNLLTDNLLQLQQQQYTVNLSFSNVRQYERLEQICEDTNTSITLHPIPFAIQGGFVDHKACAAIFSDHQIFNRHHRHQIKRKLAKPVQLSSVRNMQPGDYITHIDYGVGVFSGLQKIAVDGKQQEAIRIIYKDGDILYVHIHALHKIAKYVGKEGQAPTVHKLGADTWNTVKQRTKKRVKELAFDLIKLYAARKKIKGFAHTPDNYLQDEMEASFIYEETEDQQKAIQDVKRDMESDAPMDRLVCGDVGFGKTEVAMRAACKALLSGKQVAVLVPTTVLALQHYNTFKKRMNVLSPRINFLSRFKTTKQKTLIKQQLKQGAIDILIGTHALLAKDIVYNNLGLLIVDEEQKFGVSHKEKLKAWKQHIDYLTLTATPIPRTLQFSLMGARDISIIQTAPPNRQATQTEILTFDSKRIQEIIYHEINRGGQVFVVHNHVSDIIELTNMLQTACPDVSIDYAHGQLPEKILEDKIVSFIRNEIDVLVSTNIIENGLDIPNANTIIIHNAHHFGLSDLHQLRGRVGRSNKSSYCYLVSPPFSILNPESKQRLKTIEQHSELGSGMQIAMRDLDLRGAGNIIGAEQSGFIDQMGYETYQKILNEAITDLKEEELGLLPSEEKQAQQEAVRCDVETDFEVYIPDEYVPTSQERMRLYQQINTIYNEQGIEKMQHELTDKFGVTPKVVENLFQLIQCKIKARIYVNKIFRK